MTRLEVSFHHPTTPVAQWKLQPSQAFKIRITYKCLTMYTVYVFIPVVWPSKSHVFGRSHIVKISSQASRPRERGGFLQGKI